ncbi:MAG: hypothetical protein ACI9S8_001651 [Chlamydiales bacterium]|jgi:hypothetical protein
MDITSLLSPHTWISGMSSKQRSNLKSQYESALTIFKNHSEKPTPDWKFLVNLEQQVILQNSSIPKRRFNRTIRAMRSDLSQSIHRKALCIILHQNTKASELGLVLHDLISNSHLEHAKLVFCKLELMPPILYENYKSYLQDAKQLARQGEMNLSRQLTIRGISVQRQVVVSAQKAFDLIQLMMANQMEKEARDYTGKLLQYNESSCFYVEAADWCKRQGWHKEAMELYSKAIKQKTKDSEQS